MGITPSCSKEPEPFRDLPRVLFRYMMRRIQVAAQDALKSNTFSSILGVAVIFLNGHSVPAARAHVPSSTQFSCMNSINY